MTQTQDKPEKTAAERRLKRLRRTEASLFWVALACMGLSVVAIMFLSNSVWGVVVLSGAGASSLLFWISSMRVWIYERKARMIGNLCRKCKYDLTGLDEPELCPECGTKINPPPDASVP